MLTVPLLLLNHFLAAKRGSKTEVVKATAGIFIEIIHILVL